MFAIAFERLHLQMYLLIAHKYKFKIKNKKNTVIIDLQFLLVFKAIVLETVEGFYRFQVLKNHN